VALDAALPRVVRRAVDAEGTAAGRHHVAIAPAIASATTSPPTITSVGTLRARGEAGTGAATDALAPDPLDNATLETDALAALAAYAGALDANDLNGGASQLIELAARANRYVEERAPWKLAKDAAHAAALDTVLATLARTVARLAVLALPFMPGKAAEIWNALGTGRPIGTLRWDDGRDPAVAGRAVGQPPILYPKPATGVVSR